MMFADWLSTNIVELFGALTGILYVILEIKRNILLWPLGIITSAVYIWVFGHNGFYANMGLQVYYLVISIYGWYAWQKTQNERTGGSQMQISACEETSSDNCDTLKTHYTVTGKETPPADIRCIDEELRKKDTDVRRISGMLAISCFAVALAMWGLLWFVLGRWTDSPVPVWDGLIASLSVVATWMLTKKYIEQWYVWIFANAVAVIVYLAAGLYPTAVLFMVYFVMAIIGLRAWSRKEAGTGGGDKNKK